jgi:hypothetical protein
VAKSLPGVSPPPASRSAEVTKGQTPATPLAETKKPDAKPQDTQPSDIKPNQPSVKTSTDLQPRIPAVAPTSAADAYWTWKMLRDGYPWHDVAAIRRAAPRQLLDDLFTVSQAGHPVNPDWVEDASLRAELLARLTRK